MQEWQVTRAKRDIQAI
jgi:hypothetical protein